MKTIYLELNGISLQVLSTIRFESFNWFNFINGEKVYIDGIYFAEFVSYEKSKIYNDEIIKLRLT